MKSRSASVKEILLRYPHLSLFLGSLLFTVFIFISNCLFTASHRDFFPGDNLQHLMTALKVYKGETNAFRNLISPGVYWITAFACRLSASMNMMLFVQACFLFLCLYFAGATVLKMTASSSAAQMTVWLTGCYPLLFGLSRMYMMELACAAAVVTFVWLLMRSNDLNHVYFSMFAGICLGYGSLTKESFLLYVFPAVLWQAYQILRNAKINQNQLVGILVFILFFLLSDHWLQSNLFHIIRHGITRITFEANNKDLPFFSLKNVLFYAYALSDFCLGWFFFAFFLFSLIVISIKKNASHHEKLLIWMIFLPSTLFSFFPWKLARYMTPVLPFIGMLTLCGLNRLKFKKVLYPFLFLFGLIQFISLNITTMIPETFFIRTPLLGELSGLTPDRYREDFWITASMKNNETGGKKALQIIREETKTEKGKIHIAHLLNLKSIHHDEVMHPLCSSMQYLNESAGYGYQIVHVVHKPANGSVQTYDHHFPVKINYFDYVIAYDNEFMDLNPEFALLTAFECTGYKRMLFIYKNRSLP
ncbi:MAG: glycosyltransferase family 39 protein [Candidatus Aureabacteria bacterium]|nr:glycosyltransferase family 39 protein [Candidatus Auribacterota bacterium]